MDEADADAGEAVEEVEQPLPAATAPEVDVGALTRELYAAARAGRVERAMQLLDAGADARADAPRG